MKLLLDTHVLLWATGTPEKLSLATQDLLQDSENVLIFSVVNIWEIAIKHALHRPDFATDPAVLRRTLLECGYEELPVIGAHAIAVGALPPIHRDPFDRILVAQARVEGIVLITNDPLVARYGLPVRLV